jgi:hypothetical protein
MEQMSLGRLAQGCISGKISVAHPSENTDTNKWHKYRIGRLLRVMLDQRLCSRCDPCAPAKWFGPHEIDVGRKSTG